MTIAIDFDGTCVEHEYPVIGAEVPGCVSTLRKLLGAGHNIILYTMRSGEELVAAKGWFAQRQIPLFGLNENPTQKHWTQSPKCYAQLYIDDAALGIPLVRFVDGRRPCVNWFAVHDMLVERGIIEK